MQSFTAINRKNNDPEYTYCCGTTCDREKLAKQFTQKEKLILAQRNLIEEMESYIADLEGQLHDKKRKESPPDTFKSPFGTS